MLPLHPQHTPLSGTSPSPKKSELTERLEGRCYEFSNKPARLCVIMSGTFPWSLFLSASSLLPRDHVFRLCKRTPRWPVLRGIFEGTRKSLPILRVSPVLFHVRPADGQRAFLEQPVPNWRCSGQTQCQVTVEIRAFPRRGLYHLVECS